VAERLHEHEYEIRHFHLECGLGGGARGFNRAKARHGSAVAKFRCIGGVDIDRAGLADFERLTGVRGTFLDLFSRDQYRDFHGHEPPDDWREATPEDYHRAAGYERPHIIFGSPPCKGFSGLLSQATSETLRYQALNQLATRGFFLALEAWADDPPELFILENVPRVMTRGRPMLDHIIALLQHHGYATAETVHDCGVIGGLAQSRKRFLMVARHRVKVPAYLYEPPKLPLRGVGEVLDLLPMPEDPRMGPMHRIPRLQWRTWVRLALVPAGKDWRALNELRVEDGVLADYMIAPKRTWHDGALGVLPWSGPTGVITAGAEVTSGRFALADPRADAAFRGYLGVRGWEQHAWVVTANGRPGSGAHSVADPRPFDYKGRALYGVTAWDHFAATITSARSPGQGNFALADPRTDRRRGAFGVVPYDGPAGTVMGESLPSNGRFALADPRDFGRRYGHYLGVRAWTDHTGALSTRSHPTTGAYALADPRVQNGHPKSVQLGVRRWDKSTGVIKTDMSVGTGPYAISDPRPQGRPIFNHCFRIVPYDGSAPAVAGPGGAGGGMGVSDPRPVGDRGGHGKYRVTPYHGPANSVIAASTTGQGAFVVADPHVGWGANSHRNKLRVVGYSDTAGCITTSDRVGSGAQSIADPRDVVFADAAQSALPAPDDRLVCVIEALDGTWHRPFTTLELAALQSLFDPTQLHAGTFELDGKSDSAWRERIGNAVPSEAAAAVGSVMGKVLLMAWTGETFALSSEPIWVNPERMIEIAFSVDVPELPL
jgi:site-specific DNA-cytosine methylase